MPPVLLLILIANMGKRKHISMETLTKICETLNCGILEVIELEQDGTIDYEINQ